MSLLFIIFGRKVRDKDYGPSYPMRCPRCENDVYYHAYKWRSWFHVFWIPIIPWFSHGEVVCPVCQAGFEVTGNSFEKAKELVDETRRYREGQLSKSEYAIAVHEFESTASFVEEPVKLETLREEMPETEMEGREANHTPSD